MTAIALRFLDANRLQELQSNLNGSNEEWCENLLSVGRSLTMREGTDLLRSGMELAKRNLEYIDPSLVDTSDTRSDFILIHLIKRVIATVMLYLFREEALVWKERYDYLNSFVPILQPRVPVEVAPVILVTAAVQQTVVPGSPSDQMETFFLEGAFQNVDRAYALQVLRSMIPSNLTRFEVNGQNFSFQLSVPQQGRLDDLDPFRALSPIPIPYGAYANLRMETNVSGQVRGDSLCFDPQQVTVDVRQSVWVGTIGVISRCLGRIQIMPNREVRVYTIESPSDPSVFTPQQFNDSFGSFVWAEV